MKVSASITASIGLSLLAILGASYYTITILRTEHTRASAPSDQTKPPPIKKVRKKPPAYDFSNIPLFGKKEIELTEITVRELPQTSLPLKLNGIFHYDSDDESSALIHDGKNIKRYFVNDKIANNSTIIRISSDAVILKTEQGVERLLFAKPLTFETKNTIKNGRGRRAGANNTVSRNFDARRSGNSTTTPEKKNYSKRSIKERLLQIKSKNLNAQG